MTYGQQAAETLTQLRSQTPLVQSITNYVAMDVSANVLLALGASPAMVHAQAEVSDFVPLASALVLNIGTLSPDWVSAMHLASEAARRRGVPTVLDPVGAGATAYRTREAVGLLQGGLTTVRGNASEILALAGASAGPTRGVDSTASADQAIDAAAVLADRFATVVAVTGEVDYVTDGQRRLRIEGGHALMTKVTALGCALSGVVGACLAVRPDTSLETVAHALGIYGLAGRRAADQARGPGTFRTQFLDALHLLTPELVATEIQIFDA